MDEHRDMEEDEWRYETGEPRFIGPTLAERQAAEAERERVRAENLRLAGRIEELEELLKTANEMASNLGGQQQLAASRYVHAETENALLRRERALLVELEKARTRILASIFDTGGGCSSEDVRQVGELLMAIEAIHLEASGGVERPPGVPCACVLCRPEGA